LNLTKCDMTSRFHNLLSIQLIPLQRGTLQAVKPGAFS
jgi:hypothetical protein